VLNGVAWNCPSEVAAFFRRLTRSGPDLCRVFVRLVIPRLDSEADAHLVNEVSNEEMILKIYKSSCGFFVDN
jgi:hypothetical protein